MTTLASLATVVVAGAAADALAGIVVGELSVCGVVDIVDASVGDECNGGGGCAEVCNCRVLGGGGGVVIPAALVATFAFAFAFALDPFAFVADASAGIVVGDL